MGAKTAIEWTDSSWNCIRGCTRVSEGCKNCYAEIMAARFSDPGMWGHGFAEMKNGDHRWTGKVELIEKMLTLPLSWKTPRRIFVNSTSDLFHEKLSDEAIDRVFAVMALCPQHIFQVLTKRPERMRRYFAGFEEGGQFYEGWRDALIEGATQSLYAKLNPGDDPSMWLAVHPPLPNVWLGTSVEDQDRADERIPHLLATPAAVRFLSCEPLLGPIDLTRIKLAGINNPFDAFVGATWSQPHSLNGARFFSHNLPREVRPKIGWVIAGGESGPGARPMHPDWARALRVQCQGAGVPFFMKQMGGIRDKRHQIADLPEDLRIREFPHAA